MSTAVATNTNEAIKHSAFEVVRICRIWQSAYSSSHTNPQLMQPLVQALFFLLEDGNASYYQDEILDLCVLLRAMSRRWQFSMALLRMFQLTAHHLGKPLPPAAHKLLNDFESGDWRGNLHELNNVTSLSVLEEIKESTPEVQNMGDFFALLERLNVDDAEEDEKMETNP